MKTFSDLLGIDTDIDVCIDLSVIADNGFPSCKVLINQSVHHGGLITGPLRLHRRVALLEPIMIEIVMSDKQYSAEKETAIKIDSISIDGFDIIPDWTHLACYDNEQSIQDPTSYLGFNGKWSLKIDDAFYRWRHRITGQGWVLSPIRA